LDQTVVFHKNNLDCHDMPQNLCSGMFVTNIKSKKTLLHMRCVEAY